MPFPNSALIHQSIWRNIPWHFNLYQHLCQNLCSLRITLFSSLPSLKCWLSCWLAFRLFVNFAIDISKRTPFTTFWLDMFISNAYAMCVVGISTGYGLDGPGIESRWERDFLHLSRTALGPTRSPVQWVTCLSPGVKSGRIMTLTPHSLLAPWSRKARAVTLIPLWTVRPKQSLSACTRVHFTFPTFVHHVPKCKSHINVTRNLECLN